MSSWFPQLPDTDAYIKRAREMAQELSRFAWENLSRHGGKLSPQSAPEPPARPVMDSSMGARQKVRVSSGHGSLGPQDLSWGDDGFAYNVPRSLIRTESSGRWDAENDEKGHGGKKGHFGILQFGHGRLDDARQAGIIPADMTPEQFKNSPEYQRAVANWHFADIDKRIQSNGLDRYLGKEIGGVPVTMDSMRAMAHLGGFRGMMKFLQSGGTYNPSDANKTSLAKYGRTHWNGR